MIATLIAMAHYPFHLIETSRKGRGATGLSANNNAWVSWNTFTKHVSRQIKGEKRMDKIVDFFPIDFEFLPDQEKGFMPSFLDNCFREMNLRNGENRKYCLSPKDWVAAGFCSDINQTAFVAYSMSPENGVNKQFPYYVPVVNHFPYSVLRMPENQGKKIRIKKTNAHLLDDWHEESAGSWKLICLSDKTVLFTNPTGETLSRFDLIKNEQLWRSTTGRKPLDVAVDEENRLAYVVSAQEKTVDVFSVDDGLKKRRYQVGAGCTAVEYHKGELYLVFPYKRAVMRLNTISGEMKTLVFNRAIFSDVANFNGRIIFSDAASSDLWQVDKEFAEVRPFVP